MPLLVLLLTLTLVVNLSAQPLSVCQGPTVANRIGEYIITAELELEYCAPANMPLLLVAEGLKYTAVKCTGWPTDWVSQTSSIRCKNGFTAVSYDFNVQAGVSFGYIYCQMSELLARGLKGCKNESTWPGPVRGARLRSKGVVEGDCYVALDSNKRCSLTNPMYTAIVVSLSILMAIGLVSSCAALHSWIYTRGQQRNQSLHTRVECVTPRKPIMDINGVSVLQPDNQVVAGIPLHEDGKPYEWRDEGMPTTSDSHAGRSNSFAGGSAVAADGQQQRSTLAQVMRGYFMHLPASSLRHVVIPRSIRRGRSAPPHTHTSYPTPPSSGLQLPVGAQEYTGAAGESQQPWLATAPTPPVLSASPSWSWGRHPRGTSVALPGVEAAVRTAAELPGGTGDGSGGAGGHAGSPLPAAAGGPAMLATPLGGPGSGSSRSLPADALPAVSVAGAVGPNPRRASMLTSSGSWGRVLLQPSASLSRTLGALQRLQPTVSQQARGAPPVGSGAPAQECNDVEAAAGAGLRAAPSLDGDPEQQPTVPSEARANRGVWAQRTEVQRVPLSMALNPFRRQ